MTGPLKGVRIVEIAGIGPGPFACMMLADHGAEVIRVERPGALDGTGIAGDPRKDVLMRSRTIVTADLKNAGDVEAVRKLVATADGLVEGYAATATLVLLVAVDLPPEMLGRRLGASVARGHPGPTQSERNVISGAAEAEAPEPFEERRYGVGLGV